MQNAPAPDGGAPAVSAAMFARFSEAVPAPGPSQPKPPCVAPVDRGDAEGGA